MSDTDALIQKSVSEHEARRAAMTPDERWAFDFDTKLATIASDIERARADLRRKQKAGDALILVTQAHQRLAECVIRFAFQSVSEQRAEADAMYDLYRAERARNLAKE